MEGAGALRRGNLYREATAPGGVERLESLLARPGVRIERIVSAGQATPPGAWYDQEGEEWVALLSGSATLRFAEGPPVDLGPGDWLLIPAHARHRVESTSAAPPCVWLAVHLPPA